MLIQMRIANEKIVFLQKNQNMKKSLILLAVAVFAFASCGKKNPIVFSKKSETSDIQLTLDTNGTFDYVAHSTQGAAFNEKGTYTIEDSLLILRFQFQSYDHNCYEIPLRNDTSLIMNYKGKTVLYPTVKEIPEFDISIGSNDSLMQIILGEYQSKDFEKYVGSRYFEKTAGDMSLIFNGKWNVSPFYDSKLQK